MPDLIFIDSSIDRIDGHYLCQKLKAQENIQHISIVLLIYIEQIAEYNSYFQLGVADFISKPLRKEECFLRIRNQLIIQDSYKQQINNHHQIDWEKKIYHYKIK